MRTLSLAAALLLAAGAGAGEEVSELAVRVEEGGITTLSCDAPPLKVDSWSLGGRDHAFRGTAGGAAVEWTARRTVVLASGERVEGYRLDGEGMRAWLGPLHADKADYRLALGAEAPTTAVRFEPDGTEVVVSAKGLSLRTRTVGARATLSGTREAAFDAPRLAAIGAALALIRLDPPLRRRRGM